MSHYNRKFATHQKLMLWHPFLHSANNIDLMDIKRNLRKKKKTKINYLGNFFFIIKKK